MSRTHVGRRACVAAVTLAFVLVTASGCASGTVQAKRRVKTEIPKVYGYELCLGKSKSDCTWTRLTQKYGKVEYDRCDVGEKFPDCRSAFGGDG